MSICSNPDGHQASSISKTNLQRQLTYSRIHGRVPLEKGADNYTRPRVGPSSPFDPGLRLGEQEGWGLFGGISFPTMIEADDCRSNGHQKFCIC
jgi:hypothetical protein